MSVINVALYFVSPSGMDDGHLLKKKITRYQIRGIPLVKTYLLREKFI